MKTLYNFSGNLRRAHPFNGDPYYKMFWSEGTVYIHEFDTLDEHLNQMHNDIDYTLFVRVSIG